MSQTASKAQASAVGAVISIGGVTGSTGTETFTPIGSITDAKWGGYKVATTDVSTFASNKKRKLATQVDAGTATFTTVRVSNDPGQMAVIAAASSALLYDFKIQLVPNTAAGQVATGDLYTFSAIVTEAGGFDMSLTKSSDCTFTVDIDGDYTVVEGA